VSLGRVEQLGSQRHSAGLVSTTSAEYVVQLSTHANLMTLHEPFSCTCPPLTLTQVHFISCKTDFTDIAASELATMEMMDNLKKDIEFYYSELDTSFGEPEDLTVSASLNSAMGRWR
jgi:hypothetical protein